MQWRENIRQVGKELMMIRHDQASRRSERSTPRVSVDQSFLAQLCEEPAESDDKDGRLRTRSISAAATSPGDGGAMPAVMTPPAFTRERSAPASMNAPASTSGCRLSVRSEEEPLSSLRSDSLDHDGHVHSVIGMSVMTIRRESLIPGSPLCALVEAMAQWRAEFLQQRTKAHDPFWHRKTKKIVLAVVALNTPNGPEFVRGCNLEVSMPSGSLCAERNAIGSAVAMYPDIAREDFRGVAVLSLTDEGAGNLNPLPPCGGQSTRTHTLGYHPAPADSRPTFESRLVAVCSEWLEKIVEVNPNFVS